MVVPVLNGDGDGFVTLEVHLCFCLQLMTIRLGSLAFLTKPCSSPLTWGESTGPLGTGTGRACRTAAPAPRSLGVSDGTFSTFQLRAITPAV